MNLVELGRAICQEFEQRGVELTTLHSEIRTKVKNDRKEIVKLRDVDRTSQQKARTQIREDICGLLNKYGVERKTMERGLEADRVAQFNEMKIWVCERRGEMKGWYEAGSCLLRKRTGR